MKSCEKCRFFVGDAMKGDCRRLPPVNGDFDVNRQVYSKFVKVSAQDWCGEFRLSPKGEMAAFVRAAERLGSGNGTAE